MLVLSIFVWEYGIITLGGGSILARRKKRKSIATTLKYEITGIFILIFSVVALAGTDEIAGMGAVGHAFNYIFYLLSGKLHYVFPLISIYIGLYVLMNRKWPSTWSYRKTGLLLVWFGFLIYFHLSLYQKRFSVEGYSFSEMLGQPFDNLTAWLRNEITASAFLSDLGGGLIGAILYATLYVLFDNLGAKFMMVSLFVIGVLCITGWSLGDLLTAISKSFRNNGSAVSQRFKDFIYLLRQRKDTRESVKRASMNEPPLPLMEEFDEEHLPPIRRNRNRKKWFSLFPDDGDRQKHEGSQDEFKSKADKFRDEVEDGESVFIGAEPVSEIVEYPQEESMDGLEQEPSSDQEFPVDQEQQHIEQEQMEHEEDIPLIRDFMDHVQSHDQDVHNMNDNEAEINQELEDVTPHQSDHAVEDMLHEDDGGTDGEPGGESSDDSGEKASEEETEMLATEEPPRPYRLPSLNLLHRPAGGTRSGESDHKANARKLEATLESFGVRAKVLEVVRGPAVTRYEIQPDIGVKVSKIVSLTDDIALALAAKDIRMEAPIPGKSAIGIEVPNTEVSVVTMREVMESQTFSESDALLSVALGRDISGQPIVANLAKMPHLLVAGATGSGKSVCINGIIISILYKSKPDQVKFLMIDPKMVELNMYNGIPHLLAPVVTDPRRASLALKQVVKEMEKRYELFSKSGTRNIEGYNHYLQERGEPLLPFIVVIVDELADLMMVAAGDVEDSICRLAQMARAAGIHLIIATQRPSVDVITGLIKANIPSRIAFGVSSQVDSRTILDTVGAEKLLGRGDMLFVPVGASKAIRIQGAFLSDQEVEAVVKFTREQREAEYQDEMVPTVEENEQESNGEQVDELYEQAVQIVLEAKQASVSLLQRRMRIGYTRAARLIDYMEARGIVGPYEGSKPREVLITEEQFQESRASTSQAN